MQMKQPRLFVDAFGDLREDCQIMSLQVVAVTRPAKIEASMAHITLCIFAAVTNAITAGMNDARGEWTVGHREGTK